MQDRFVNLTAAYLHLNLVCFEKGHRERAACHPWSVWVETAQESQPIVVVGGMLLVPHTVDLEEAPDWRWRWKVDAQALHMWAGIEGKLLLEWGVVFMEPIQQIIATP